MTNRATLEALLARVLEGTGPDRELDGDLAEALQVGGNPWKHEGDGWISVHGFGCQAAMFTKSLDAALTLVPEGWGWARTPQGDKVLVAVFIDIPLSDGSWKSEWIGEIHADDKRALIAACLKARMEALGE